MKGEHWAHQCKRGMNPNSFILANRGWTKPTPRKTAAIELEGEPQEEQALEVAAVEMEGSSAMETEQSRIEDGPMFSYDEDISDHDSMPE